MGFGGPRARRVDDAVEEGRHVQAVEQPGQAGVEVRDDADAEPARADLAQRSGRVREDPPGGRLRIEVEQVREASVEAGRRGGAAERTPNDRVPPRALVVGQANGTRAGEGERRGSGEGGPERAGELRPPDARAVAGGGPAGPDRPRAP